ncbi:replicative DNA helicase [Solwaraspora sp. WMMD406]|uniref:replicative DNA helicase n=1 Tax=Solwaraspora sp. WMMD406 TaxID=3016095 RepID=UPI0032428E16
MSITDDIQAGTRPARSSGPAGPPSGGGPPGPPSDGGQFDRTPPQDIAAEQCVLGGMLLSKDAIADVVEILKSNDFYRPIHATIFDAVLDLYGRGEPADPITVSAALADSGDLGRIGGAPYLHTLIASVPTAANAAYYARIVAERAVLRRLVEAGTRIVQLGYGSAAGSGRDIDDVVDLAQQAVYDVTERRVSEDFAILADMLQPTLDEIEAVGAQGGVMTGVPTGFTDLDRLLNGLHPGQLIIVAGRPGLGKALALDTPLPTPTGWTTMGEVDVGDQLVGADGRPTTVIATSGVMLGSTCYQVEFSDGSSIVADADHLWQVSSLPPRLPVAMAGVGSAGQPPVPAHVGRSVARTLATDGVRSTASDDASRTWDGSVADAVTEVTTTERIAAALRRQPDDQPRHAVRNCRPLALPDRADLPEQPYELGVALATDRDPADVEEPEDDRGIPDPYLRASESQRRALLAGLLDAAGTVSPSGLVEYRTTSRRLIDGVRELIASLGYHCTVSGASVQGRMTAPPTVYTLTFDPVDQVFSESGRQTGPGEPDRLGRSGSAYRHIVAVRPVPSVAVRCVTVANADHLYLAGRTMIPTHNSTASMDFARNAAIRHGCASAIFSLEMSKVEIVMRLLSAEAKVPLHVLRSGQLSDDDWTKLARRMGEISEAPLFVDDTPNMNLMEIRAKARRLRQRHDLKMIVVDYLQLMSSPKRTESRQQEVAELSRGLKLLAKEVECPVIAVSQLNRGPEQRTDKRPQLSDLRESGCLTAATRLIRADDNSEVALGDLLASGATDVPVWALDESLRYTPRTLTHVFPSGHRTVFRLTLASGKQIEATANHPFLTVAGWTPLGDLTIGTRLATPRHIPPPLAVRPWAEPEVVLLAHLLGAGSFARQPVRYVSRDEANLRTVAQAAKHFGIDAPRVDESCGDAPRDEESPATATTLRLAEPEPDPDSDHGAAGTPRSIARWLDGMGLLGLGPDELFVPPRAYSLPKEQVTILLGQLWSAAGSIRLGQPGGEGSIELSSPSRRLLEDVSRLLLRYGVTARLTPALTPAPAAAAASGPPTQDSGSYLLDIAGRDDQLRFLREIGGYGGQAGDRIQLLTALSSMSARPGTEPDATQAQAWRRLRAILTDADADADAGTRAGTGAGRPRLAEIAEVLDAADLDLHATNDIYWDEIVAIEPVGERDVFDATVLGTHNFIANGIAAHNSIEQDADVVILLHRDDYYDKESPRAGEADFIVAKHRNGPTDTVTVAAQLHLSRFVDMAI